MRYDWRKTLYKALFVGVVAAGSAAAPILIPLIPASPWGPVIIGAGGLIAKAFQDWVKHRNPDLLN